MSRVGSYSSDKAVTQAGSTGNLKARFEQMAQKGDEVNSAFLLYFQYGVSAVKCLVSFPQLSK